MTAAVSVSEPVLSEADMGREHMEAAYQRGRAYYGEAGQAEAAGVSQPWQLTAARECMALYGRLRRRGVGHAAQ